MLNQVRKELERLRLLQPPTVHLHASLGAEQAARLKALVAKMGGHLADAPGARVLGGAHGACWQQAGGVAAPAPAQQGGVSRRPPGAREAHTHARWACERAGGPPAGPRRRGPAVCALGGSMAAVTRAPRVCARRAQTTRR